MDEASLDAALSASARRSRTEDHPPVEDLLAHATGELSVEARDDLQEHLARCPQCAGVARDLAAFPDLEPPPGTAPPDDERVQAAWRRFARAAERHASADDQEAPPAALVPPHRAGAWAPLPWALAAALLLATLSLGFWGLRLQRDLARLADARINVPVVELAPVGEAAERGPATERVVVASGGRSAVFVLELGDLRPFARYRVRLLADGQRELWSRTGLEPRGEGRFTLELPLRLLAPGRYELRLSGLDEGAETTLASYRFAVSPAPNSSTQIYISQ